MMLKTSIKSRLRIIINTFDKRIQPYWLELFNQSAIAAKLLMYIFIMCDEQHTLITTVSMLVEKCDCSRKTVFCGLRILKEKHYIEDKVRRIERVGNHTICILPDVAKNMKFMKNADIIRMFLE